MIDNEKNEKKLNADDFKMCSPQNIVNRPKLPYFSSNLFRPSKLNSGSGQNNANTNVKFTLNPSRLNPFASKSKTDDECEKKNGEESGKSITNGDAVKFVPLVPAENKNETKVESKSSCLPNSSTVITNATSFVFGENLQARVVTTDAKSEDSKPSTSVNTNGSADMLFSNAAKKQANSISNNSNKESKSLIESAQEYEQSRAVKRKFDEVEVKTGEEDETNILNISCKLFAFDSTSSNWQERGRGILRLNDFECDKRIQSRLVFRTSGSFRVILNTKVFAKMSVERASERSIRLTALDASGEIKVFLVMSSIEDSKSLFLHLKSRITKEIEVVQEK